MLAVVHSVSRAFSAGWSRVWVLVLWQVGLAVVNGQLMAIGGFDGTTYLKTVEMYDPEQNCWKIYGGMNYRRLGGGVGVVKMPHPDGHLW